MPMHKLSFEEFFEDGLEVNTFDSLYIIVDGDKCRRAQHDLHNVPLLIKYKTHTEKVDGQYCMTCHQTQIRRNIFAGLYQEYALQRMTDQQEAWKKAEKLGISFTPRDLNQGAEKTAS